MRKTEKGWRVDIRPNGRDGKRVRKLFETKAEALRFEAYTKTAMTQRPDWQPAPKDRRTLSALITRWHEAHGQHLRAARNRLAVMQATAAALGDPPAIRLNAQAFVDYRAQRLAAGVSANTVNHEHAYLRALFNELERLGEWSAPNPLAKVRRLRVTERELSFLNRDQVRTLLAELGRGRNRDALQVARVCLATGARWSESETLRGEQIGAGLITFAETKNGRARAVPIMPTLAEQLRTRSTGRLFGRCYDAFRHAIGRAGIELPDGQLSHVLRHTFASFFMQNGGNILTLQRILGHASLTMTMRYAHLAPDHLEEARTLNPLRDAEDG